MAANCDVELSLYPLRTGTLEPVIEDFVQHLRVCGLTPTVGCMSTVLHGEVGAVFDAVGKAFAASAASNEVVLVMKVSNACPRPRAEP